MKRYLLPCSCSRRIPVAAGQAGGSVRCPGCGAAVAVPRLGALSLLETVATGPVSAAAGRAWSAPRACLLGGVVVALAAAAAATWLRGWRSRVSPLDESAIQAVVVAASADQAHQWWLEFERQGIVRPPLVEEQRRAEHARSLRGLETVAWLAAAAGAAAGLIGAVGAGWQRRVAGAAPL